MSEQGMESAVQEALEREGIDETVLVAGQFSPRGHSGSMVAGQMAGSSVGSLAGAAGEVVGGAAGIAGGMEADAAARGLPEYMLVGVTDDAVYGFEGAMKKAGRKAFQIPREGLEAKVHQRVDVKVLELINTETGESVELEGNRLPLTHSKDVISVLTG
jgi:hypothetical protein